MDAIYLHLELGDLTTEPHSQPLSGELLQHNTAIRDDSARLDVKSNGQTDSTPPISISESSTHMHPATDPQLLQACTRDMSKGRGEHTGKESQKLSTPSFPPWFSQPQEMGRSATTMYQRLAAMIAKNRKQGYSHSLM